MNAMNAKSRLAMERIRKPKPAHAVSYPTIPCCQAMREGYPCDCCEVVDA